MGQVKKPKLAWRSVQFLVEIDQYIRHYNVVGMRLPETASDVLDGAVFTDSETGESEVDELIRNRLLAVIGKRRRDHLGQGWTVELTPTAILRFWPDRQREIKSSRKRKRTVARKRQ